MQICQQLDLLLEAMAELRQEGISRSLVVVGDGAMGRSWKAHAASLGLSDQVRLVGRVRWEGVPNHIAGFDIGFAGAGMQAAGAMYRSPLKFYEYAAMGKPVLAAAHADASQLVSDGAAGYLFDRGSASDLRRALLRAYQERERWTEMGLRSREVVVTKYSWEARLREAIPAIEGFLEARYGTPYPARRHR